MRIVRYEIVHAKMPFKHSEDARPWLILEEPVADPEDAKKQVSLSVPISSQFDLYDKSRHFLIPGADTDFKQTGLRKGSYIIADWPVLLHPDKVLRKLTGELLQRFQEWAERQPGQ